MHPRAFRRRPFSLLIAAFGSASILTPNAASAQSVATMVCTAPPENVYTSSAGMKILANVPMLGRLAGKVGLSVERRAELIRKELPGVYDFQVLEHVFCKMESSGRINHTQYLELVSKVLPTIRGAGAPTLIAADAAATASATTASATTASAAGPTAATQPAATNTARTETRRTRTAASPTATQRTTGEPAPAAPPARAERPQQVVSTMPLRPTPTYDDAAIVARIKVADSLWTVHLVPEAIDSLSQIVADAPTHAVARNQLAWFLAMIDRPHEALTHALKAVESSDGKDGDINDTLAYIYASMDDFARAEFYYQKAVDVAPTPERRALFTRKLNEVRGHLVPDEPDRAYLWYMRGQRLYYDGDFEGALGFYQHAVAADPKFWQASNSLAWTLAMLGDGGEALPYARASFDAGGSADANVNDTVGYIFALLGDFANAEKFYRRAVDLAESPEAAEAFRAKLSVVRAQRIPVEPEARN